MTTALCPAVLGERECDCGQHRPSRARRAVPWRAYRAADGTDVYEVTEAHRAMSLRKGETVVRYHGSVACADGCYFVVAGWDDNGRLILWDYHGTLSRVHPDHIAAVEQTGWTWMRDGFQEWSEQRKAALAMATLMDAVGRALAKAGHPSARGRLAGWRLVGYAERVDVVWLPETRHRSPDRRPDALAQAEAHAASARGAGFGAVVLEDGGWPVCRVTRRQAATREAA